MALTHRSPTGSLRGGGRLLFAPRAPFFARTQAPKLTERTPTGGDLGPVSSGAQRCDFRSAACDFELTGREREDCNKNMVKVRWKKSLGYASAVASAYFHAMLQSIRLSDLGPCLLACASHLFLHEFAASAAQSSFSVSIYITYLHAHARLGCVFNQAFRKPAQLLL